MRTGATVAIRPGGHLLHGLAQALAVWLAASSAALFVARSVAVAWAFVGVGLLATVVLGQWHKRRSRPDTAVGVFAGAVLWPVVLGLTLIAITVVSTALSDFE